jgi:DNA-binding response OmpR family regulator
MTTTNSSSSSNSSSNSLDHHPSVLIVEDDPVWRRIIRHTLSKHGVLLMEATTLQQAVDTIEETPFDMIVLDYDLVDGPGLAIFDRCDRSRLGFVVLATGFADPHELHDDRIDLVDRYLTKPFLSSDLLTALSAILSDSFRTVTDLVSVTSGSEET